MINDYEHIKERLDLQTIITQETGLKMKGHHLEECPFCQGHECFSIKDGRYKCFQCDVSGDIFTFLEIYKKIDKSEVLKKAAQLAGITLKASVKPKDSGGVNLTIKETIFIEAANHYHANISRNGGKVYLIDQRGHTEDVLNKMKVGWSFGELVEYLRSKGFKDEQIKASGLAREKKIEGQDILVDFFKKGIAVFPHWAKGKVLHFTMKDPEKKLMYQLPNDVRSKDWKFYNQGSLGKFSEIILVEGENDTLSIIDNDVENVIGAIGSIADYQVKALKTYCASKHLYLWFDNDKAGRDYVRKICTELAFSNNIHIIVHDENFKDPDEYIRAFDGDRKKEIKRLQAEAVDYVSWEISEISKEDTLEERLKALRSRNVFNIIAEMVEVEKHVYIEKITKLGFPKSAIEQELEANNELHGELSFELIKNKEADPIKIGGIIFRHFNKAGKCYRDREGECLVLYRHHIFTVGNNIPFNALLHKLTGLQVTREPGRSVWDALKSEIYNNGKQINLRSWLHTDRENDTIFINFNSPNNTILKINKKEIEEIPNGLNNEEVLLKASQKILPFNFLPDADIGEGMTLIKELVFDCLTCEKEQRYLILCWFMSVFLFDFSPYFTPMKFSGAFESGKSTPLKFLSLIIYGEEHLYLATTAGAYRDISENPLLILDDQEQDEITKSLLQFIRLSATGAGKLKSAAKSDHATVSEKARGLIALTSIDPLLQQAIISRIIDIEFCSKFFNPSFIEDDIKAKIKKNRDLILSSILKFICKDILPNIEDRKKYITILKIEHAKHSKRRMDEYLALLMLMLEKMLKYISYYEETDFLYGTPDEYSETLKEIRKAWIDYQNAKAKDNEISSNSIIKLLDGLMRDYVAHMREMTEPAVHKDYPDEDIFHYTHPDYHIEAFKTKAKSFCTQCHKIRDSYSEGEKCECGGVNVPEVYSRSIFEFTATPNEIVGALDRYCRNNGIKNPYSSSAVFTKRLNNDERILKSGGWELVRKPGSEAPYFKKIHNERFLKLHKVIIK